MARMVHSAPSPARLPRFYLIASLCLTVAALYLGQEVLKPIALAILLSFLLAPIAHRLERLKFPRGVAVVVVVLFAFSVIGTVSYVVYGQVADLAEKLPEYKGNIESKINSVKGHFGGGAIDKASKVVAEISHDVSTSQPSTAPAIAGAHKTDNSIAHPAAAPVAVTPVAPENTTASQRLLTLLTYLEPLARVGLVIILVIFILLQRDDLRDRIIRLAGHGHLNVTTQALEDAAGRVSRYLMAQSLINGCYGIAIAVGLYFIGVPNSALWGLLCGLMRFIPYVGPWIGASMPIFVAVGVFEGHLKVALTLGLFVACEVLTSMFFEPLVLGARTGVSPLAILIGAAFWTWIWGPIGLVLATPLTVCMVVMGKYVPQLEFLNILLGDEEVLAPRFRYYQRLLAEDPEDAAELIEEYLKEKPLEEIYDTVVIPALAMAERDLRHGRIDVERHQQIIDVVHEMVKVGWEQSVTKTHSAEGVPSDICAICLPARGEADEVAALMMAQILTEAGICAKYASVDALASEMLDTVDKEKQEIIIISALPPQAVTHARYLVKLARARWKDKGLIAGLWHSNLDVSKVTTRLVDAGTEHVAFTFAEAREQTRQLIQPFLLNERDRTSGPTQAQDKDSRGVPTAPAKQVTPT
jgi:predicted PurR-regulated permease PerM